MHRIFLLIAALPVCAGLIGLSPVDGQTPVPTEETRILTFDVFPSNGFAEIGTLGGSVEGLRGASCTGDWPLAGARVVPLAVMTTLDPSSIRVRVVSWAPGNHIALVNNTFVNINCAIDAPTSFWESPVVAAKVAQLRQQARK
jgi:hypothetical protein